MSKVSKRKREGTRAKIKAMGDHKEFLKRITKTLYYGQLPSLPCLSFPVTEISCEVWSGSQRGRSVRRLHADAAAELTRQACVSPCALVLAILYLERLNACNPDYIATTHPQDLFLVSLMVGNKFLQDGGEDDEVICSEWAASGGVELKQLKKLEIEFLCAIDWNVFVSDASFEAGLAWLERQVALRQAQLRGFFTYSDLAATCDADLVQEALRGVWTACLAASFGYLASILTLLTSTLVVSQAWLPALHLATPNSPSRSLINHNHSLQAELPAETGYINNTTIERTIDFILQDESLAIDKLKCCTNWLKLQQSSDRDGVKRNWYDNVIIYDWSLEPWRAKTSVLNWLYQTSLVNPMQRWLEKMNEYGSRLKKLLLKTDSSDMRCMSNGQRCVHQWLNLSKLSALVVSVSDR